MKNIHKALLLLSVLSAFAALQAGEIADDQQMSLEGELVEGWFGGVDRCLEYAGRISAQSKNVLSKQETAVYAAVTVAGCYLSKDRGLRFLGCVPLVGRSARRYPLVTPVVCLGGSMAAGLLDEAGYSNELSTPLFLAASLGGLYCGCSGSLS